MKKICKAELTKLNRASTYLLVKITNAVKIRAFCKDSLKTKFTKDFKVGDRLTEDEVSGIDCQYSIKLVKE